MKNRMIKVGTAVPKMSVADVNGNTDEILKILRENSDCGILVFPELCLSGYTCADLFQQTVLQQACISSLIRISEEMPEHMTVVVGLPLAFENNLYNVAAFVSKDNIAGIVPKSYIPNYGEFYEARWFTPGDKIIGRTVQIGDFDVPFGIDILAEDEMHEVLLGAEICEDLWVPDKPSTHACLAGATIIANLSASNEAVGKAAFRRQMIAQQSSGCYCAYLYTSAGMDESSTDLVFSGHSVIAVNGRIKAECLFPKRSHVETAVLDLDEMKFNRLHQTTYQTGDSSWYRHVPIETQMLGNKDELDCETLSHLLSENGETISRYPFVPTCKTARTERCFEILNMQAQGLATRLRATGLRNMVLGVSGGLDSTWALVVCHEVTSIIEGAKIIAYTMPSSGQTSNRTYENALRLMKSLDCEIHEVPIRKTFEMHLEDIGHGKEYKGKGDVTYENAQARMRTMILMDAANMENGLVIGTGDLSELAMGWCTYNGDHMSMYGVNGSIPKTLMQYLVESYAESTSNEVLKETLLSVLETPISPELTPNTDGQIAQKTEEQIGKYDLNDFFLFYTIRYGYTPDKILAYALNAYSELNKTEIKEAMKRFYSRFFSQQFKRSCLPDGVKVGSVSLSPRGDWRMPSDASKKLWMEILENA